MKIVAILLCTVYFASYAVVRSDDEVPSTCLNKIGITVAELPGLFHDRSDEGTRKRGCLEACVMQKMGLMDGNTINEKVINEQIGNVMNDDESKEETIQAVHQCIADATNDDQCLAATNFNKCILDLLKIRFQQLMSKI